MKNLILILAIASFISCNNRCDDCTDFFEKDYCGWKVVDGQQFESAGVQRFTLDSADKRVVRKVTLYTWNRYHLGDIICNPSNPSGDKK